MDLKRLEDFSEAIVLEFKDMKKRADEMRNTNGIQLLTRNMEYKIYIFKFYLFQSLQKTESSILVCSV